MSHTRETPTRQRGFSLLELLVAFAIMAFSLGMLYQASGGSVRHVQDTAQHQRATAIAQSILALQDAIPQDGWVANGESAGMRWQVRTAPFVTDLSGPDVTPLHQVWLSVSWDERGRTREIALSTLRPQLRPVEGGRAP